MQSVLSSVTHWRTTLPGLGALAIAFGHYWLTGQLSHDDLMAIFAGFGLVAAEGK